MIYMDGRNKHRIRSVDAGVGCKVRRTRRVLGTRSGRVLILILIPLGRYLRTYARLVDFFNLNGGQVNVLV